VELRVLGVYQLDVTPEVFAAQLPMYGDEDQCRRHFSSVVLVEGVVDDPEGKFLDGITQPNPAYPGGWPQAPYDEGLLSADGEHGEIVCPAPQPMSPRLETLMPYRPCD
jgi:hypothetical protein